MKKLILIVVTVLLYDTLTAQSFKGIEIGNGNQVNYYYLNYDDYQTLTYSSTSQSWPVKGELVSGEFIKHITRLLAKKGCTYDPKNDTIVLADYSGRLRVYTKNYNRKYYYDYKTKTLGRLKRGIPAKMQECDYAIYEGNIEKVKNIVKEYGYCLSLGAGYALRIIIKDDQIQYPIDLWRYYAVQ